MKKLYLLPLFLISSIAFGQVAIFDFCGGDSYPDGWTATNNVNTNVIEQPDYFLLEAGDPSDVLETGVMDLSLATSLFVDMDFATDNGTGADNEVKIEISYDGGSNYTETIITTSITGSYGPSNDLYLANTGSQVKLRFSNNGTSGKGVKLLCLTLTAMVSFPVIQVDTPEEGEELPVGTTSTEIVFYTYNVDPSDYVKLTYTVSGDPTVIDLGVVTSGIGYNFATENGVSYLLTLTLYNASNVYIDEQGIDFSVASPVASIGKNEIEGFNLYPNPIKDGSFKIMSANRSMKSIQLFDMLGKRVLQKEVQSNQDINVDRLNAGIYILKVEEEGKIATRKLVIE